MSDPGTMKLEALLNMSKRLLDNSKKRLEQLKLYAGSETEVSWQKARIREEECRLEIHRLYYTELYMLVTGQESP